MSATNHLSPLAQEMSEGMESLIEGKIKFSPPIPLSEYQKVLKESIRRQKRRAGKKNKNNHPAA